MKTIKQILEKNYFEHLTLALEKQNNERGFGPYIHFFDDDPKDENYILPMKFNDFLCVLMEKPIDDLYFFGPIIDTYKKKFRFRLFIKNRKLERYFKDTSDFSTTDVD